LKQKKSSPEQCHQRIHRQSTGMSICFLPPCEGATAPGESQSFEFTVFWWTEFKKTLIASFGWKLDFEE
jgi:hypothetical protein